MQRSVCLSIDRRFDPDHTTVDNHTVLDHKGVTFLSNAMLLTRVLIGALHTTKTFDQCPCEGVVITSKTGHTRLSPPHRHPSSGTANQRHQLSPINYSISAFNTRLHSSAIWWRGSHSLSQGGEIRYSKKHSICQKHT